MGSRASTTGDAIFDVNISSSWSINAFSQHPDLAAEFLNYLFSPEAQVSLLVNCGMTPAPIQPASRCDGNVDPRIARDSLPKLRRLATMATPHGRSGPLKLTITSSSRSNTFGQAT
ncbi:MAG: hypothetical protein U0521_28015 [Anaerolineae bacterium]